MTTTITDERAKELREYLARDRYVFTANGDLHDASICNDLLTILDDYAALKAELENSTDIATGVIDLLNERLKKAEAELATWKEDFQRASVEIGVLKAELAALKAENERLEKKASDTLAIQVRAEARAEKAEAELAEVKPLIEAVMAWDGRIGGASHTMLIVALDDYRTLAYREKKGA